MTGKLPVFSIIIPTLNEERFLPALLSDIAKQTLKQFEVIIVDAHSDDHTISRANKYLNKIPLTILTSKRRNVSIQRNAGAEKATGTWILFFDADNRIAPDFLTQLNRQIVKHPTDLFTCWAKCDSDDPVEQAVISFYNVSSDVNKFLGSGSALGAMIGVKRGVFAKIEGFDSTIGFAEDTDFVRKATEDHEYHFSVFHKPTFTYNLRRMRKMGAIPFIIQTTSLFDKYQRKKAVNQSREYPMGGHVFKTEKHPQRRRRIKSFLRDPFQA